MFCGRSFIPMLKFILRRLSLLIPTLFGVVTLVFAMIALSPGDPARVMLGERATKESVEHLTKFNCRGLKRRFETFGDQNIQL